MGCITIDVRLDEELKTKCEKIFRELGFDMATSITLFLKAVERNNGFPFPLEIPNEITRKALREVDDISSGKVKAKRYQDVESMKADLNI